MEKSKFFIILALLAPVALSLLLATSVAKAVSCNFFDTNGKTMSGGSCTKSVPSSRSYSMRNTGNSFTVSGTDLIAKGVGLNAGFKFTLGSYTIRGMGNINATTSWRCTNYQNGCLAIYSSSCFSSIRECSGSTCLSGSSCGSVCGNETLYKTLTNSTPITLSLYNKFCDKCCTCEEKRIVQSLTGQRVAQGTWWDSTWFYNNAGSQMCKKFTNCNIGNDPNNPVCGGTELSALQYRGTTGCSQYLTNGTVNASCTGTATIGNYEGSGNVQILNRAANVINSASSDWRHCDSSDPMLDPETDRHSGDNRRIQASNYLNFINVTNRNCSGYINNRSYTQGENYYTCQARDLDVELGYSTILRYQFKVQKQGTGSATTCSTSALTNLPNGAKCKTVGNRLLFVPPSNDPSATYDAYCEPVDESNNPTDRSQITLKSSDVASCDLDPYSQPTCPNETAQIKVFDTDPDNATGSWTCTNCSQAQSGTARKNQNIPVKLVDSDAGRTRTVRLTINSNSCYSYLVVNRKSCGCAIEPPAGKDINQVTAGDRVDVEVSNTCLSGLITGYSLSVLYNNATAVVGTDYTVSRSGNIFRVTLLKTGNYTFDPAVTLSSGSAPNCSACSILSADRGSKWWERRPE